MSDQLGPTRRIIEHPITGRPEVIEPYVKKPGDPDHFLAVTEHDIQTVVLYPVYRDKPSWSAWKYMKRSPEEMHLRHAGDNRTMHMGDQNHAQLRGAK